jgi:hypothetical protein
MLKSIMDILRPNPEQQARMQFIKNVAASGVFVDTVSSILDPGEGRKLNPDLAIDAITELSNKWMSKHAAGVFPTIDELEIRPDLVINHLDHDKNENHHRLTLRQLSAWVDTQKRNENVNF